MAHAMKTIMLIGICLGLLSLSACAPAAPASTSTPDLNPFRTQVAATVLAQVTRDLALTPSATSIPNPTATQAPTETLASTPASTDTASPGPQETQANGTPGTPGTPGTATADLAEWVSQSIADGTVFAPGETFTITWTLKNVGTSTWTPNYLLRFYIGNAFGAPQEIFLDREVPPGETIDIAITMKAPTAPGEYRSDWVMADPFRSNFKEPVYLEITVARPTATPTATVAPTTTSTPTVTATP